MRAVRSAIGLPFTPATFAGLGAEILGAGRVLWLWVRGGVPLDRMSAVFRAEGRGEPSRPVWDGRATARLWCLA